MKKKKKKIARCKGKHFRNQEDSEKSYEVSQWNALIQGFDT